LNTGRSNKQLGEARKGEFTPAGPENSRAWRICGHDPILNNMKQPLKILTIQFKYLGDAVLMTPALRAIREHYPDCALHLLVPEEVAPLLRPLPWLTRLWLMPRKRGHARISQSWPVIRALRAERFDRSVEFSGGDRGAILSWLCGARERLGPFYPGGFLGRRFSYTQRVTPAPLDRPETARSLHLLSKWGINSTRSLETEIHTDPALDAAAQKILPEREIICHLASSQPKKEWPLTHWVALYQLAAAAGLKLIFATGTGAREESFLKISSAGPGCARVAADSRPGVVPRGAQARQSVRFRRHRSVAFCRRRGRADPGPVRGHFAGALGAGWRAPPFAHWQSLFLQRQGGRLPERESLPGGDFARTGFGRPAKHFDAGVKTLN
jgi:ADP-heptose:LPS heptosyltransferase